jgi:hypothetical protein
MLRSKRPILEMISEKFLQRLLTVSALPIAIVVGLFAGIPLRRPAPGGSGCMAGTSLGI